MVGTAHTFASYFTFAVDAIIRVLWREGVSRGPQELVRLTGNRIRRLERRFNALVARWRAGTLPVAGAATVSRGPQELVRLTGNRIRRLERRFNALVARWRAGTLPVAGQPCVGALCLALNGPEMAEFYAAAPQAGKILRPLVHMIGAPLPEWLKLRRRVRVRKKDTSPRPSPQSGEGEGEGEKTVPNRRLPAREQAEDAVRRSETSGKPIALEKFLPEAFGWWAHPPRDDNCPPPKIGYGGRLRPLPKDYEPPRDE